VTPAAPFIALAAAVRPSGLLGSLFCVSMKFKGVAEVWLKAYGLGLFFALVLGVSWSSASTPAPSSLLIPAFGVATVSDLTSLAGDVESCCPSLNVGVESASTCVAEDLVDSSGVTTVEVDNGDAFG